MCAIRNVSWIKKKNRLKQVISITFYFLIKIQMKNMYVCMYTAYAKYMHII